MYETSLTPAQRSLRGRIAAHHRWANTPDRTAATSLGRKAFLDRFERQVDPEGKLSCELRSRLAENARKEYFSRLAQKSAQSRAKKS